jgi:hypothetical protein
MAPAVELSANSETETGSTVDSESEHQDPTISIKNTFVHIEMDNADPRIIQSMPAGTFAANIEAEKKESAIAETCNQKRRPSALSQISPSSEYDEAESEIVASLMFPSTPNGENFSNLGMFHDNMTDQGARQADAVPVVQWIPPTAPATESVTILPPACFTAPSAPVPVLNESSPSIQAMHAMPEGQGQSWGQEVPHALPNRVSHGPPQGQPQGPVQGPSHGPSHGLPPTQPQGPSYLVPGTPVVLQGLANQPDFNGLQGIVSAFDAECGRYNVMIEIGPNAHRRLVKVKSQNLQPAQSFAQVPHGSPGQLPCCHPGQQQVVAGRAAKASLVLSHMV